MEKQSNFNQDQRFMSDTIGQLAEALSKAQGEFLIAIPSKGNSQFKNKYCDMKDLVKATRTALVKYNLAVNMTDSRDIDGKTILITILTHSSNEFMISRTLINPEDPKNPQKVVGYDTYMGRKCYKNITGVVCDDDSDDDGEEISQPSKYNSYASADASNRISEEQLQRLNSLSETSVSKILGFNKVNSLNELTIAQYDNIVARFKI